MTEQENRKDVFYIGWQEENEFPSPGLVRKFLVILGLLVFALSFFLVINQKGFEDSTFELGQITELEGIFYRHPVPMLKVSSEVGHKSVLLIGFGKFSATGSIEEYERAHDEELDNKRIRLRGTRVFHNGKELFELTEGVSAILSVTESEGYKIPPPTDRGEVSLFGEIYDPKCALGVMKPGSGKPHRSCAIRCISGGIPPILHAKDKSGQSHYFILKGPDGEDINFALLDYVADQIKICGQLVRDDDWWILRTDPKIDIQRLQPFWMKSPLVMCSEEI